MTSVLEVAVICKRRDVTGRSFSISFGTRSRERLSTHPKRIIGFKAFLKRIRPTVSSKASAWRLISWKRTRPSAVGAIGRTERFKSVKPSLRSNASILRETEDCVCPIAAAVLEKLCDSHSKTKSIASASNNSVRVKCFLIVPSPSLADTNPSLALFLAFRKVAPKYSG